VCINPLNAELNPICHLLALLGAHHILHVSRIRVKCGVTSCFGGRTGKYLDLIEDNAGSKYSTEFHVSH
jgi:hypothetical protein